MRDLEKQIADWRRSIADASKHRPETLNELETHLRDEIDRLIQAGTPAEDAFTVAFTTLGSPAALCAEFDKLEQLRRAKWKPATFAQWACIAIAVLFALALVPRIGHGRMTLLLASHVLTVSVGYVMMFIIGGLAICHVLADWFQRTSSSQTYALRRTIFQLATISAVLTAIGILLGMMWAKHNWSRYWAWDPKETGAVIVLVCATFTMGVRWFRPASHNALVIMGILGNIGTGWGWLGANTFGHISPLLIAFFGTQCLLLTAFSATTWLRKPQAWC
ncbi:MAG TPA: cytochrome c biogenesis protein CcsA [Candidatus Binatia bacterium]|nr:cytochrome c biogenesis protein CcsA [Candidatus Binatia bacterium]